MDKETYRFMCPSGIASFSFRFSDRAMQWLCGTTTDDNARETSNFALFGDLLQECHLQPERAKDSADRSCFPQVRRSIPKNSFPRNGTWAGNAYATCWPHLRRWGLSTLAAQGWLP